MDAHEAFLRHQANESRLWAYIVERSQNDSARFCQSESDHEAYALFRAISQAFTARGGSNPLTVTAHYELFQYMADWAMNKVGRGAGGRVTDFGGSRGDHHLQRVWNALFWTLQEAVKKRRVVREGDEVFFGYLPLPAWFVEHFEREAFDEAWAQAHHTNDLWDRDSAGDFRDFVRRECRA